jgi:uncharacterized repeat protein (TIGR01451 family)
MQLRRRAVPVLVAVTLTAAALLAGISSAPATPTASVAGLQTASWVAVPGSRRLTLIDHPAGSAAGRVACTVSAQKTTDGVFLRFRYACVEYRGAIRLRDYYRLAKAWLGRWVVLWLNGTDVVAAQTPIARFTVYSPALRLCQVNPALVWWQGEHQTAMRWKVPSTLVTTRTMWSEKFQERMLVRDTRCVAPPPPTTSTTTSSTTSTTAAPVTDLEVAKSFTDVPDPAGDPDPTGVQDVDDNLDYTIPLHNAGTVATNYVLTDTWPAGLDNPMGSLPAGCTFVDPDPATNAGETVRCTGTINPGQTITFTLHARTNGEASGPLQNTVTVTSSVTDPVAGNNTASLTVPIAA